MSERSRYALQRIFILASHREDGFRPATFVINRVHDLPCFSERSFKAPGHGCVRKRRPATSRAVISLAPKVSASRLADSATHLSAFLLSHATSMTATAAGQDLERAPEARARTGCIRLADNLGFGSTTRTRAS